MKLFSKLSLAILFVAAAGSASAVDYTVRITGATAFRGATHNAVIAFLGGANAVRMAHSGGDATTNILTTGGTSGNATGSNYATYVGTVGSDNYTIQLSFSGSVEGIRDIGATPNQPIPYIPGSSVSATAGFAAAVRQSPPSSVTPTALATDIQTGTTNITFSDVDKSSTPFSSAVLNTPTKVGVLPFVWVANKGATNLTNITSLQARRLLTSGFVRKNLITGVVADDPVVTPATGAYVFLTGRNKLSGSRVAALAEMGHGVFTACKQYFVLTTSGGAITEIQSWPDYGTTGDVDSIPGNGGYISGGTMATAMGNTISTLNAVIRFDDDGDGAVTPASISAGDDSQTTQFANTRADLVASLGNGDAATLAGTNGTTGLGGVRLAYNGVSYIGTNDNAKVQNGSYTFWSNELLYTKGTLSTGETNVVNSMLSFFTTQSNIGNNSITMGSMVVNRTKEGTLVGF